MHKEPKKLLYLLFTVIASISLFSCTEDLDPTSLNPEQLAIYNKERPRSDRKQDNNRKTEQVLTLAAITPGMKVADLDAGNGYYTELFSSLVGMHGKVYMQNGSRYVAYNAKDIDERLENNRLPNVERIDSHFNALELPDNLDFIFISLAFHDIYVTQHQEAWNADTSLYIPQIIQALKVGGRLMIIDHSAEINSGTNSANTLHRIDEEFTRELIETSGFKLTASSDILRNSSDDRKLIVFDKNVSGKTDKFILVFTKL